MDSESFANMIKKKPVSNITPIPAPQPQKYDKISIYASLKYLGEQIGSVCESLKGIQISQDRSLADLQSVVSSLNTNASQNSEFELSEIQQTVNKMKSKLEELHSDVVKAVTVEKISNITPNKSQTGGEQSSLEDKVASLERKVLLLADQLRTYQNSVPKRSDESNIRKAIEKYTGNKNDQLSETSEDSESVTDDNIRFLLSKPKESTEPKMRYSLKQN